MKLEISQPEQLKLREELTNIASRYLTKEYQGLFTTTTNLKDDMNTNIIRILESLVKVQDE